MFEDRGLGLCFIIFITNQCDIQEKLYRLQGICYMFIKVLNRARRMGDLIKTLNREKLEPGAASCRNWQSRKLGFREPELTRRVESLYLIVRAGDGRERSTVGREQTSYGADISPVNSGALIRALSL